MWAKQSTAATLIVGPILDSTGAEYASAVIGDLSISKNGGTLTALAAAATLTVIANGQYTLVMTTGNLDTLGRLQITCNKSTFQMPTVGLVVVPAMVFDSIVLGTDVLQGDVTQFGGTALTAAAGIPEVKVVSIAANAVNASSLATDAVAEIQSGLATQTSVDTIQSDTNDIQTRLPGALESGRIAAALDSTATAALVDLIWDEPLTGATHNVATSSGKRLRQTTAFQQIDSTVIDAAATTTTFITGLTSSVDDFYNDSMLVFTDGALAGQVRAIYDYIGATKTIILEEALTSAPVNGVAFAIVSLHIHPVSQIQSGLATAAALATESTKITAIETFATRVTTGLVADGAVYQFTANMLELAPSSGGGAGDASQATLLEVKAKTDLIGTTSGISSLLAASVLTPGTITEFPDTLTIGDSYTTANGRSIQIPIVDTDGNQISSTGSLNFADATATFVIKRAKETDSTRIITGTAAFTDPVGTGTSGAPYAVVQLTSSETAKGLIGYKYSGVLTFTWPYVGTGTDPEVMSFETDTVLFDN
jgi:hypothetical protein